MIRRYINVWIFKEAINDYVVKLLVHCVNMSNINLYYLSVIQSVLLCYSSTKEFKAEIVYQEWIIGIIST